uniref:Uncharacterized protein n=1 Tax=Anguilla anguilla TaxID=7936 RepID=A0A0E9XSS4_ANGAN
MNSTSVLSLNSLTLCLILDTECLTLTVKGSVMLWGTFSWHGLGPLVP